MAEAAAPSSSTAHSSPLINSNSAHSTPRAVDSSSFASCSPPGSPRVQSIRRKPAPPLKDEGDATSAGGLPGEGQETLADVGGAGAGAGLGRKSSVGSSTGVSASPSSTYSVHLHSFPPQSRSNGGASSPAPAAVASSSTANPAYYTSTHSPGSMSAAARSPLPSTSRDHIDSATFHPGLSSRPSIHSQRSSVAPESVYGTAPVGVIGKHKPREVIRVERDYSGGELCQFWSGWIWELEGRVSEGFGGRENRETRYGDADNASHSLTSDRYRPPTSKTPSTSSTPSSPRRTTPTSPASTTASPS